MSFDRNPGPAEKYELHSGRVDVWQLRWMNLSWDILTRVDSPKAACLADENIGRALSLCDDRVRSLAGREQRCAGYWAIFRLAPANIRFTYTTNAARSCGQSESRQSAV